MFDEVITFEFNNLDPIEVEQAKINISVFDANVILRDVLIGIITHTVLRLFSRVQYTVCCEFFFFYEC